jgi:hypothetical protein
MSGCGQRHRRVRKRKDERVENSVIASAGLATSGDDAPERAFEAVVTADVRRLYSLAPSILDDAGEAEDAVQETLLKAWRAWGRRRAHGSSCGLVDAGLRQPLHQPAPDAEIARLATVKIGRSRWIVAGW